MRVRNSWLLPVLAVSLAGCLGGPQYGADSEDRASSAVSSLPQHKSRAVCGDVAQSGYGRCLARVRTKDDGITPDATTTVQGMTPAELQSAYAINATLGTGMTVAIVDAFDDPNAEADLGVYRTQFGLPACTTANGCFKKVNQTRQHDEPTRATTSAGPARSRSTSTWPRPACPKLQDPPRRGERARPSPTSAPPRTTAVGARRDRRQQQLRRRRRARATSDTASTTTPASPSSRRLGRQRLRRRSSRRRRRTSLASAAPRSRSSSATTRGWVETVWQRNDAEGGTGCSAATIPSRRGRPTPAARSARSPTSRRSPIPTPASRSTTRLRPGGSAGRSTAAPAPRRRSSRRSSR